MSMPTRLVALDDGADIALDRAMLVVGRHPQCDARLDSIRVSRRHCCMMQDKDSGDVVVRDLGSTNGIRINGQRVEMGKLRPGDELAIAHIRFRLEAGQANDVTLAETLRGHRDELARAANANANLNLNGTGAGTEGYAARAASASAGSPAMPADNALAAAVRELLPSAMADRCRIQVIVHQVPPEPAAPAGAGPEPRDACPPDSSR